VVSTILGDPMLSAVSLEELDDMRARVRDNRRALAEALRDATGSDRMGSVAAQQGMFSILPLTEAQVTKLREDHGIYMLWDGRVNMAGMDPSRAGDVARAVAGVMRG